MDEARNEAYGGSLTFISHDARFGALAPADNEDFEEMASGRGGTSWIGKGGRSRSEANVRWADARCEPGAVGRTVAGAEAVPLRCGSSASQVRSMT